jgi:dihydroxyacetone kinase-like predicted kinase
MIDEEKFMLTVFCGKATNDDARAALESAVNETYPDVEAYFIEGGQDVYPYIFIVE